MLVDHEKNALCDGYIVEFIHDATEIYYEGGIYACRSCNNIKFPHVLKVLKLCLFCLPMLVDYCSHKLFAHKIPKNRKCVRLKCASHMLHDAPVMFQFLSFMWVSLSSSCLARKALKKSACWETTQYFILTVSVSPHDYATVVIMFYSFCFNKVPSKTFRIAYGDSCVDRAENQKLLHPVN